MATVGYSFEELEVYRAAREYRRKIYQLVKMLPAEERYNLKSQMQRAAVAVTNNIAEGHGRFHFQENIQFLRVSRGSLEELIDDLNVCIDEGYIDGKEVTQLKLESYALLKRLNGYLAYLRNRQSAAH